MRDFNVAFTEANTLAFCNEYKLKALNKEPTCFKNYISRSCINLYLTNSPKSSESTLTREIGLCDFHKLIVTVLKFNSFKHNVVKWPNILWKSCGRNTARFLSMFSHFTTLCLKGFNMEKLPLRLYNTETTKILTRQDLLKNFKWGLPTR